MITAWRTLTSTLTAITLLYTADAALAQDAPPPTNAQINYSPFPVLAYEAKLGVNPFKFGMVGSTDAHTSLATTQENNFFGKVEPLAPSADPIRFEEVIAGRYAPKGSQIPARMTSASGLAAVWARENTREALWDAMARKEVFATTGTRLRVRVFAGFDFTKDDLERSDFAKYGYENGVPMGGDLKAAPQGKAPSLLIRALRDVDGANLDRIQVIKGWLDAGGQTHEKVYDVAWSNGRQPGTDGKLPPVGNTVNVEEATYTNAIGTPALQAYWQDPEFDAAQRAFYYVRVVEIPTPRWTTFDAKVSACSDRRTFQPRSRSAPTRRRSGTIRRGKE